MVVHIDDTTCAEWEKPDIWKTFSKNIRQANRAVTANLCTVIRFEIYIYIYAMIQRNLHDIRYNEMIHIHDVWTAAEAKFEDGIDGEGGKKKKRRNAACLDDRAVDGRKLVSSTSGRWNASRAAARPKEGILQELCRAISRTISAFRLEEVVLSHLCASKHG